MTQGIIWFRNDLRIHHNAALNAALESALPLKAVYFFDARIERLGRYRRTFIREALDELTQKLKQINITIEIIEGNTKTQLLHFFTFNSPSIIFASLGYAYEEQQQEQAIKSLSTINLQGFDNGFLIPPENLPFGIHELPDTFTAFRKKIEQCGLEHLVKNGRKSPNELDLVFSQRETSKTHHPHTAFPFYGGESAAMQRLNSYLWQSKNILRYKETRNGLLGVDYSSKFSAWLACGCISPKQIYDAIKRFEQEVEANESTYWLIFELLWREYFRYVMLKFGNKLFLRGGIKGETASSEPADAEQRFEAWINGCTGDDFVDANMRELKHTGFMSNRGRQNVASYLVHQLKLDWRRGAYYFEKMLIDYDVFSNWGNWAYLAGVGNDPRENRMFNTQKQAEMYDPDKAYRKSWLRG